MITLKINKVPTLFIKAFTATDVNTVVQFVRHASGFYCGQSNQVLFIDTPITPATVDAVAKLRSEGFRVVFRDHHGIDGTPCNDREKQVAQGTARLQQMLGEDCRITVRRLHPACSTLVSVGEFADAVAIIADPDADGLTAAMKAAGVSYAELDDDAARLDGEPQLQTSGSPLSQLLAKGIAVIPSYDPGKPHERESAHQRLFSDWLKAVAGNDAARKRLEALTHEYDRAVEVARELASRAFFVAPGVVLADVAHQPLYDPGTLNAMLEADPECKVTVVRKSLGPIAAIHGIQYSLSVAKPYQEEISLYECLPSQCQCEPDAGIISNVSFLLHVSEDVWNKHVLPALRVIVSKKSSR